MKELAPFVNRSDAYRARAEACLKLAEVINDPHAKPVLASMAEAWLRLADFVERLRPDQVLHRLSGDACNWLLRG